MVFQNDAYSFKMEMHYAITEQPKESDTIFVTDCPSLVR